MLDAIAEFFENIGRFLAKFFGIIFKLIAVLGVLLLVAAFFTFFGCSIFGEKYPETKSIKKLKSEMEENSVIGDYFLFSEKLNKSMDKSKSFETEVVMAALCVEDFLVFKEDSKGDDESVIILKANSLWRLKRFINLFAQKAYKESGIEVSNVSGRDFSYEKYNNNYLLYSYKIGEKPKRMIEIFHALNKDETFDKNLSDEITEDVYNALKNQFGVDYKKKMYKQILSEVKSEISNEINEDINREVVEIKKNVKEKMLGKDGVKEKIKELIKSDIQKGISEEAYKKEDTNN